MKHILAALVLTMFALGTLAQASEGTPNHVAMQKAKKTKKKKKAKHHIVHKAAPAAETAAPSTPAEGTPAK